MVIGHEMIFQTGNSMLMSIGFRMSDGVGAFRVLAARCRRTRGAALIGQGLDRCNLLPRGASVIVNGHDVISQTCNSILMSIWFHIRDADGAIRVPTARCRGTRKAALTG